jgi:hypothetical protein
MGGRKRKRVERAEGVSTVPIRLLLLCKLFNSCLSEVREREVEEKRNRRLVPLLSLQLA